MPSGWPQRQEGKTVGVSTPGSAHLLEIAYDSDYGAGPNWWDGLPALHRCVCHELSAKAGKSTPGHIAHTQVCDSGLVTRDGACSSHAACAEYVSMSCTNGDPYVYRRQSPNEHGTVALVLCPGVRRLCPSTGCMPCGCTWLQPAHWHDAQVRTARLHSF